MSHEWRISRVALALEQGDTEDQCLFVLNQGFAAATLNELDATGKKAGEKEVGRLKPGSVFGETALINSEPRNANIVATTRCKASRLDREEYQALLGPVASGGRWHAREHGQLGNALGGGPV